MDREALQGLSREELIELVIRLGEMVVAAGQQPERLAELERRLAELQAEVQRLSTPPKTSALRPGPASSAGVGHGPGTPPWSSSPR